MEGKVFWIKYLENRAVSINTHFIGDDERKLPLKTIDNLISAYHNRPGSSLANVSPEDLFLLLPAGTTRKDCTHLGPDAFAFEEDENDTCLRSDLSLASLGSIGCKNTSPLIIKAIGDFGMESGFFKKPRASVTWKNDSPNASKYSLDEAKMFFVNREIALEQLQTNHALKYARASTGSGDAWTIPLADNVFGLGKSEFGRNYIRKCRERWPNPKNEFEKTICACHTVRITFARGSLLTSDYNGYMIRLLIDVLQDLFEIPPSILENPPEKVHDFLSSLSKWTCAGPLFIVLDEIGSAFCDGFLGDFEMRDRFFGFCITVLSDMLLLKNIFFVVLGRASFLGYAGLRPIDYKLSSSPFIFERLNLHLIRPDAIATILNNTFMFQNSNTTVREYLKLKDDQTVKEAAMLLFKKTNGHPRSLLQALRSCRSLDDVRDYNLPITVEDENLFRETLFRYKKQIMEFAYAIKDNSYFNLAASYIDIGGKVVSYDYIANNAFISWEGEMEKAKLYIHPLLKSKLAMLLYPFADYVRTIANAGNVSVHYPNVFEWMCLKRFQEIFIEEKQPYQIAPELFTQDMTVMRNLDSLKFSGVTLQIPKITQRGDFKNDINSSTAKPDDWSSILAIIQDKHSEICLKPRAKSASSDAFLIAKPMYHGKPSTLIVGLAVKNYSEATKFSQSNLERECDVFNRMFSGSNQTNRISVLIVCCTNYDSTFKSQFEGKLSVSYRVPSKFPNINEIILVNLCDTNMRDKFFNHSADLKECIENVIGKDEREFDETVD